MQLLVRLLGVFSDHGNARYLHFFGGLFQSYIFRADKKTLIFPWGHGVFLGSLHRTIGQLMLEHFAKNRSSLKRLGLPVLPVKTSWFFDHATEMVLREIMFKRDKLR